MLSSDVLSIVLDAISTEVPVPAPFLRQRYEEEDGILIVSLPAEEGNELAIRTLNRSAALVYLMCDGSRNIGEIVREVGSILEGNDRTRTAEQVVCAIRSLQTEGLLRRPRRPAA
jgi:Coenzyme PQQ synthesis protein D (PqqD)